VRSFLSVVAVIVGVVGGVHARAADASPDAVRFTIRVCEGENQLEFWFNDEAKSRWDSCRRPLADVPVGLVTESGNRGEAKTGADGIVRLPEVKLSPQEKFRLAMACSTHRCLSIHDLFVGTNYVRSGSNLVYVETVRIPATDPE